MIRVLKRCLEQSCRVFLQRYVQHGLGVVDRDDDAPARHSPSTKLHSKVADKPAAVDIPAQFALCVNSCELLLLLLLLPMLLLLCV